MDDMIDELYEDVVLFLEERPGDKSEIEALEFYLEFEAGGGERHKGGDPGEGLEGLEGRPCSYCAWYDREDIECFLESGKAGERKL